MFKITLHYISVVYFKSSIERALNRSLKFAYRKESGGGSTLKKWLTINEWAFQFQNLTETFLSAMYLQSHF